MNRIPSISAALRQFAVFFGYSAALVLLVMTATTTLAAGKSSGVDAVLIMDSSGSMAKSDPDKLRIPAAKLFMSLLGDKDRIGLISFSDNGYPVLHLTAPSPKNNARILSSADKVSSKGVYTNLHAALLKGVQMLDRESDPQREKMLVLMSDGKMDVGDTDEDWQLTQKVQGELLKNIKKKNIKVYTIAFTEASDVDLLKDIAHQSKALFKLAKNDTDLHEVFSAIFESAKSPDMLPIEGEEFVVDSSIKEVTIVASKEREDVRIYLQSPEWKKLSADDAGKQLNWFMSQHFDMITLRDPEPGTWKLLFTGGRNRAYIVTNMALNHNPQQPQLNVGEDMVLEAWLEQDGKRLEREAVLTNTQFKMKIEAPDGANAEFEMFDTGEYGDKKVADGIYSNTLAYENPGSYRIDIIAKGETFSRQTTVHFEVAEAPVDLKGTAPPAAVEPTQPEPAAQPEPKPEQKAEPEKTAEPIAEAEPPIEEPAPAADTAPPKKKGINLGLAIGLFLAVNILLGLIGFGVWWFLKKRKQKSAEPEEGEEGEE